MTNEQMTKGLGGFIIIRDAAERALALPRTYGIDDIPLALTSRRYDANNQFSFTNVAYGDYMLTNGTPSAQISLPKQFVRLRILNAEIERGYDIGFSDNRNFYIIANDGGLLNTPLTVNRVKLLVGERIEILVNLSNDLIGSSIDLKAYNGGQTFGFPGGEPATSGQFGSLLNNTTFNLLHINVIAATNNAITTLPTSLISNTYWTASDATVTRTINVTDGNPGPGSIPFRFDNTAYAFNTINKTVSLNAIEKWTVKNNNVFGHTFHIHDVEFKIVDRNGNTSAVGNHESGWKDVMFVPVGESVSFVAKFEDYSDDIHPFMYHCHFANHEDGGMMGQFVVSNPTSVLVLKKEEIPFTIYPNPSQDKIFIKFENENVDVYYITVYNAGGKAVLMLPKPEIEKGINISNLSKGIYYLQMMDNKTKSASIQKFVKN
jgi:bilirubin oxidase